MKAHGLQTPISWPSDPSDGSIGDPSSIGRPMPAAGMAAGGATTAGAAAVAMVGAAAVTGGAGAAIATPGSKLGAPDALATAAPVDIPAAADAAASASATLKMGGAVLRPVSARPPKAPPRAPAGVLGKDGTGPAAESVVLHSETSSGSCAAPPMMPGGL
mmetsp:Transcript_96735/g.288906  ORF Transcript_96735/g.288906 Transcript_96735/m.288906 type:complete len:160 (+) Transcript_96735:166-645(+)|eukprot:CAMPEP_0175191058 /NCGR_PEP_ID=MMETSP0093-20121207/4751_1 /TAXON_ID=311494 /ORGANISM="Alexandrium monilatum, Strain CCMP3105" /LENGTH=159 /DNA_ID=CAMNT_0016483879 /DNA_START=49 /DNA_END=528 /DNA_ORIENTATION=+